MQLHHDKHHQAYVTSANAALEGTEWADKPVEEVLKNLGSLPQDKQGPVRNNAGGHYNHSLFWEWMSPNGGGAPDGALGDAINSAFGSFDDFKAQFKDAGVKRFGSGWAWLVNDGSGLAIVSTPNQDNPISDGKTAAAGRRRVGARLLPEVPEPPPRLPRRLVERRQLGQGRGSLLNRTVDPRLPWARRPGPMRRAGPVPSLERRRPIPGDPQAFAAAPGRIGQAQRQQAAARAVGRSRLPGRDGDRRSRDQARAGIRGDDPYYERMATHPGGPHTFPYAYRVAVPWIVHVLPFSHATSFTLLALLALAATGGVLFTILRMFGIGSTLSAALMIGLVLSPPALVVLLRNGRNVDPESLLILTLGDPVHPAGVNGWRWRSRC